MPRHGRGRSGLRGRHDRKSERLLRRGNNIASFRFAVEKLEVVMVDPKDKDPAEGSRETVDKELARQGEGKSHSSAGKSDGQKGPAQPSPRKK